MPDREKVIDDLIMLKRFMPSTMWKPINDAIELLKEQEGTIRGLESCLQETLEELTNARKETEAETSEHSVKQEDVAGIMNTINDALEGSGYCAVGYDNTGTFLQVLIEGTGEEDDE